MNDDVEVVEGAAVDTAEVHIEPKDTEDLTPVEEQLAAILAKIARRTNARFEVSA